MEKNMLDPYPIYKTLAGEIKSKDAYDAVLRTWPVPYEELDVNTRFGLTHLIVCGPGNGRPLLLLHGQEASATMWFDNIQSLSRDFSVYAVDTIGDIGKSRLTLAPKNRADYAAWLLDILNLLKLERVDLVGMSYGGFLALNFALANPNKVGRIALLAPGIPNFGPPTLRWASFGLPMLMTPSRFTVKRFLNGASQKGYLVQDLVQEQMMVAVPQLRNRNFMRPEFSDEELGKINFPCLLLIGDHEIMYDPVKALERASQLIPNLETAKIANAGHSVNSDQPEIVDEHILKFLKKT